MGWGGVRGRRRESHERDVREGMRRGNWVFEGFLKGVELVWGIVRMFRGCFGVFLRYLRATMKYFCFNSKKIQHFYFFRNHFDFSLRFIFEHSRYSLKLFIFIKMLSNFLLPFFSPPMLISYEKLIITFIFNISEDQDSSIFFQSIHFHSKQNPS